ncbi:hypothetical protein JQX09_21005 [Sulfitobacter pseudonitzschiae]|jgi:hypothetical protein|uniref:Uncharacterized protein n=1 Tax=Pseudosulfitobacter pseudonitzschiae TaxID=1402135 RepID=A0A9Q2NST0_9RHOB|nr:MULTISPECIES: hypothetical protein [Roseobacteraceae]MBM2294407.1 hypothetical protein [Pseudosulfitobacter pseudonitzschiae]MBM2299375.1 hypothetical protein [Pseudosulfitobacter pseudonitzschiae]MBM2304239.1 hypothetical protein [Pseudosulfitobacter pseudonitzschiae]MBM2314019.1 hypothetical protein [Pseudosulfitobacter pseudonitzschiae]MBM2318934.1 hypothetical protein [Pseudosulfitobacter pseudonitzschiae]|tara:strand:+ start:5324 stop:5644 length:321 start_codon:yes stop_codon:yes gene_type:complete
MIDPDLSIADRIGLLVQAEVEDAPVDTPKDRAYLAAFRAALVRPFATTVNFSGGLTQTCWTVTRTDGDYRVIYMPRAGYFALCVESDFGPLDIGVHGPAMGCFASV